MSISAGIVGLPNVGKSTIFNALTSGKAEAQNYPFCTIDPNRGIVAIPDERLARIAAYHPSQKVVPAFLELIDIAGLVKGASMGEGLGNQFLAHIRDVNAVAHVVRCFDDPDVAHVDGTVNPLRDISIVNTELMLKDLDTVGGAAAKLAKAAKVGDKEARAALPGYEKVQAALASGAPARSVPLHAEELAAVSQLGLLTCKPVLYVANVDEQGLAEGDPRAGAVADWARAHGSECVTLCGKVEAEIARLAPEELAEFLAGLGLVEPGLNALARALYHLLGLQTFFTVSAKENHAWTVRAGAAAPQAAGAVHSDFEKGFIRAEVHRLEDLDEYGSEAGIRAAGRVRSEGREYIVKDGDIMFFRFGAQA